MVRIAFVILLGGCSASGGTYCDIARIHRFSDAAVDAMTDAEVNQEQAHNETVDRLCG